LKRAVSIFTSNLIDMKSSLSPCNFIFLLYMISCSSSNTGTTAQTTPEAPPQVKSVFINGENIHYVEMGKGDPVVLVHGSLGDYRSMGAQMDSLSKKYRVIAYSRRYAYPNNNIVNDTSDFSVHPHVKDLGELLKALKAGPAHLIGHSYGAFTALLVAMEQPELVKTLTLAEPPVMSLLQNVPGGDTLLNNFITKALIPASEAFKRNDSLEAIQIFITGVTNDSTYYSNLPPIAQEVMNKNILEMRGASSTSKPFPAVSCEDLNKVKVPVLLVKGDKSPQLFISITNELERCLANQETVTLQNTSHGLPYENPKAFNAAVMRFYNKK
jgi:pimeloyl-ACP methyl ester carboxylesterase